PNLEVAGEVLLQPFDVILEHLLDLLALLDAFDFQRFHEGLEAGAELARRLGIVRAVYSEHGVAVFLELYVAGQRALEAPEVAELDVLVYYAVGIVLTGEAVGGLAALLNLLIAHKARAFACDEIVAADLPERALLVVELYYLAAGEHAEAET